MTTLEIILSVLCYVILVIASIRPFKKASYNGAIDNPMLAVFFSPFIWILLTIIAAIEGFKTILKD